MSKAFWRSPYFVLISAVGIILFAYGGRQSLGMFLRPVTESLNFMTTDANGVLVRDFEPMSFATAIQVLIYGCAAPFVGAIADRWGPIKVLVISGLIYAFGLFMMSQSTTQAGLVISIGFLMGIGSSGIALPMLLSIVGRVAPEERRTFWLAVVVSGGTAGQMLIVPFSNYMIGKEGWVFTCIVLAVMALMVAPLSMCIRHAASATLNKKDTQSLGDAIKEAGGHRGFWLLVMGFYVCGFQVQFINNHLENYLDGTIVGGAMAATAIALIGLFNMFGTQTAGVIGDKMRKKYILAHLYMARSVIFLIFFIVPVSKVSVIIFACSVGFLWLATVPLTSGIVAQVFGPRYLATLYGVVFLSHQLGSFTSVWLGGIIRTQTGSYDYAWYMIIVAGFVAALLHWPIDDKPVARLQAEKEAAT
ncbi:MAG: MFS transporter [Rhodospirillaceae bacterium]|nr:MFS transporter [Rhodospirillaceae bacterium]|tara:strand:- start:2695 stop:3948 length:1254 start_codon:yes stop_codon:yes gene_type:complete